MTILECVSVEGQVVPPSFVLQKGTKLNLRGKIDPEEFSSCITSYFNLRLLITLSVYFSESGWTDTYNCEQWIKEVFIPFTVKHMVDTTILIVLYMDGHDTHKKPEIMRAVYHVLEEQNIEVIIACFPSKTTHKCQPLDVGIFSHVKSKWQGVAMGVFWKGEPINQHSIIPLYVQGTRVAFTKEIITSAFEKTGLHLVDRTVFKKEDFAPFLMMSHPPIRMCHLMLRMKMMRAMETRMKTREVILVWMRINQVFPMMGTRQCINAIFR